MGGLLPRFDLLWRFFKLKGLKTNQIKKSLTPMWHYNDWCVNSCKHNKRDHGWLAAKICWYLLWRFFGSSIHVSSLLMDGFPEEANRATRIEEIAIVVFPVQIWLNNICIWNFCLKVVFFTGQTEKKSKINLLLQTQFPS